jgi:heme-degrading monooxygenase HmoA
VRDERVAGNRGIYVLGRDVTRGYEFALLTLWESTDAAREFAGEPIDRAYYGDYHRRGLDYLIEMPPTVEQSGTVKASATTADRALVFRVVA